MRPGAPPAASSFADETAAARDVLVVETAGLGDLVHSLPALWSVRCAYPEARLHCLVRQEHADLLRLVPWIDRIWTCRRGHGRDPRPVIDLIRSLREQRFDVAIDLMGSEYASAAVWLSGAGRRLVRRPGAIKRRWAWRWAATDLLVYPFGSGPMYLQRWRALQQAGITTPEPTFELRPSATAEAEAVVDAGHGFVHVSPCSKRPHKELPRGQLAELLASLRRYDPELRLVISCSRQPRELRAVDELLGELGFAPWRVFRGSLNVVQLYRLLERASLHLSGDTGSMHLAWLAGTPTVTWMSSLGNYRTWAPVGDGHAIVGSIAPPGERLLGISTEEVVAASLSLMGRQDRRRGDASHSQRLHADDLAASPGH